MARERCPINISSYRGSLECYDCWCADFFVPGKDIVCRCPENIVKREDLEIIREEFIKGSERPTQNKFIEYLKEI